MAYNVALRRREFAVRMALGASPASVMGSVMRRGLLLLCSGLVIGVAASLALSRSIAGLLHGVGPWDVPTYAVFSGVLTLALSLACLIPALRASAADPVIAIKEE